MAGFTKLFSSIVHSTIWRAPNEVRLVWVTMLALSNRNGVVEASLPGLADAARVSLPECEAAINELMAPDPYSRTKDHEGRRIIEADGGWQILNYLKYRELRSEEQQREKVKERVARHRATKRSNAVTRPVTLGNVGYPIAEAEAEAKERKNDGGPRIDVVSPESTMKSWQGSTPSSVRPSYAENPLIKARGRDAWVSEALQLVQAIGEIESSREPEDILAEASKYEGSNRTKLNPATMSDDRLMNTVRDLRANLEEARKRAHPEERPLTNRERLAALRAAGEPEVAS